MANILNIPDD